MFSSHDFFAGGPLYSGPPHLNATGRAQCAAATCPGAPWSDLVKRTPWNSMEIHGIPLFFHQFSSPRGRFWYILIIFHPYQGEEQHPHLLSGTLAGCGKTCWSSLEPLIAIGIQVRNAWAGRSHDMAPLLHRWSMFFLLSGKTPFANQTILDLYTSIDVNSG